VLINTLFGTRFDAGAEKVMSLYRDMLSARDITAAIVSVAGPEPAQRAPNPLDKSIANSSAYFPYPARPHGVVPKTLFHMLENYNPLALARVRALGIVDEARAIFTHNLRGLSAAIWSLQNTSGNLVRVHYIHDYQLLCTASSMYSRGATCTRQCRDCALLTAGRKKMSAQVDVVYGASAFVLQRHLDLGFFRNAVARVVEPPLPGLSMPAAHRSGAIRCFGFFGRLVKEKGIGNLLDAFVRFRDGLSPAERSEVELLVAGDGEDEFAQAIISRIKAMPCARYLGPQPPSKFFPQIDVLVVPSVWHDPNPMVVVEAYEYAKPVIGAYVGGVQGSVIDGKTGIHFNHEPGETGLIAALQRAWRGLAFDQEEMARLVGGRNIESAVDTLLADIDYVTASRPPRAADGNAHAGERK
jgi:glycosyltransferase involved in cell wall biosynthesis